MVAALYRRYRPETFAEMIGQSQVTEPLMTALRTGRIGHAYLFSGPRGCGKTTSARILARCLNCAEGPTDTPCGVCPSCVELSRNGGGSLDVVEMDAASNGGVDDARDLRERAVFAPARDRFKIFIIDEAHMVSSQGFNALLKIVEEPPPHVKFIFATTEPDKVIGTIRSRTHHYPFRLIAPATLIDYVQTLCDSEGVQVEPGVLPLVVRAGGGSVRDTLSILDQLIAGSEGTLVTADRAAGLLGFTHAELLDDVVAAFGAGEAATAFAATDRVVQTGQDPRRFVEDLLERLRDLIVVSATTVDGAAAVFRGVPHDQLTRMFEQAQAFGPGELSRTADVVSEALDKMAGATAPRLQLELMVARVLVIQSSHRAGAASASLSQAPAAAPGAVPAAAPAGAMPSGAGSAQAQAAPQRPPAAAAPAPQPKPDPLAALAAARGAVREQPAPATQQAPTTPQPAAAPQGSTQSEVADAGAPMNAAETAASIREFLREDPAGAAAPAPEPQPAQPAPQLQAPAEQHAQQPHPNAGAASFGRPISDVLSAAQLAGIGNDSAFRAAPDPSSTPAPGVAPATPPARTPAGDGPAPATSFGNAAGPQPGQAPSAQPAEPSNGTIPSEAAAHGGAQPGDHQETEESFEDEAQPGGFEDLLEVWPDLLEEILESDRAAWNAITPITPLGLEGDVLSIGVPSRSDLDAFKAVGSGPLREAILSATGLSVRYKPVQIAPGSTPRESSPSASHADATGSDDAGADRGEPHRAGPAAPSASPATSVQASSPARPAPSAPGSAATNAAPAAANPAASAASADDPVARAAARLSGLGLSSGLGGGGALGPALAAPAWADPVPAQAHAQAPVQEQTPAQAPASAQGSAPAPTQPPAGTPGQAEVQAQAPTAAPSQAPEQPVAEMPASEEPVTASTPVAQPIQAASSAPAPASQPVPGTAPGPAPQAVPGTTPEPAAIPSALAPISVSPAAVTPDAPAPETAAPVAAETSPATPAAAAPVSAIPDSAAPGTQAGDAAQATSAAEPEPASGPEPDYDPGPEPYDPYADAYAEPEYEPRPMQTQAQHDARAQDAPALPGSPVGAPGSTQDAPDSAQSAPATPASVPGTPVDAPGTPVVSQSAAALAAALAVDPEQAKGDPASQQAEKSTGPKFTRYGEAIVREVLGARFIEERPLPQQRYE